MNHSSVGALLIVSLVLACNGRSRVEEVGAAAGHPSGVSGMGGDSDGGASRSSDDDGPAGAGNAMGMDGTNGAAGASSAAGGAAAESSLEQFFLLWKHAQSQREPGEPSPGPGAERGCFDCISSKGSGMCRYPADSDCEPYTACVERHCLNIDAPPGGFTDCVESCLPVTDVSCGEQWLDYASCVDTECTSVCE